VAIFVAVLGAHPASSLAGFDRAWIVVLITAAMTASAGLASGRRLIGVPAVTAKAQSAGDAWPARSHRQPAATSAARRSPLHRIPAWLRSDRLPGHRPPPAASGKTVVLRDGSAVLIRPVHSTDAPLLADGFARLSDASRQMRFLTRKKELSPAELRYFTDVDHHDHEALGALDHAGGRGVGIARYVRDAHDPHAAEIAVTIIDDWQGRGLGTELLAQLSDRARQEGIRRFTALVAADNVAIAGLLQNMSAELVGREPGTLEYEITLAPEEEHNPARMLRARDDPPSHPPSRQLQNPPPSPWQTSPERRPLYGPITPILARTSDRAGDPVAAQIGGYRARPWHRASQRAVTRSGAEVQVRRRCKRPRRRAS
jgi:RimJ/RimL family protein N-acetyltransferase